MPSKRRRGSLSAPIKTAILALVDAAGVTAGYSSTDAPGARSSVNDAILGKRGWLTMMCHPKCRIQPHRAIRDLRHVRHNRHQFRLEGAKRCRQVPLAPTSERSDDANGTAMTQTRTGDDAKEPLFPSE